MEVSRHFSFLSLFFFKNLQREYTGVRHFSELQGEVESVTGAEASFRKWKLTLASWQWEKMEAWLV